MYEYSNNTVRNKQVNQFIQAILSKTKVISRHFHYITIKPCNTVFYTKDTAHINVTYYILMATKIFFVTWISLFFFMFCWPCISVQFLLITNLMHFFNVLIYFTSLHVSSNPVLIIQENWLYQYIIWYVLICVGDCLVCWSLWTSIPDSHLHRVIYTRWCIDTIDSPDDECWVTRNM
jgi:hypothetical protein